MNLKIQQSKRLSFHQVSFKNVYYRVLYYISINFIFIIQWISCQPTFSYPLRQSLLHFISFYLIILYIVLYSFQRIYINFYIISLFFLHSYTKPMRQMHLYFGEEEMSPNAPPFLYKVPFHLVSQSCCQKSMFRGYYLSVVFFTLWQGLFKPTLLSFNQHLKK